MGETSTVTRDAFPNCAGKKDIDDALAAELEAAGIEVHRYGFLKDGRREVDTEVAGELHGWNFRRAWYYWTAEGPGIEVAAAERLHATCGQHVRVNGHCGCPSPTEQNKGLAIGSYHVDRPSGLKALADTIRALVARSAAGASGDPAALTKLAEIPPAGSADRLCWLLEAERHGFERTSGGEEIPEYDPPAYFATRDELLTLMSEVRKQGQRDAMTAGVQAGIEAAIRGIDATILNIGSDCDRRGIQDPETGEVPCDGEEEAGCACSAALELGARLIKNLRTCDVAKITALATGGARG